MLEQVEVALNHSDKKRSHSHQTGREEEAEGFSGSCVTFTANTAALPDVQITFLVPN